MALEAQITVVGGGIGGLAAALACARAGAEVTVLERAEELTEVGAGIQISPNGWRVLEALGVAEPVAAQSPRSAGVRLRDFRRGRDVFSFSFAQSQTPYHMVHRADLIDALAQAATAAGVAVRLGTDVVDVSLDGPVPHLTLADGTSEAHALVLAADGLHSPARRALNPRSRPYFTGQVAWRALVPAPEPLEPEAHVFMGPGRHLVRYPLRDRRLINIVAVEERDAWAAEGWHHRDDPKALRRAFVDFCPEVRDLLAQVVEVYLWGLFRHPVAETWTDGRLALLGDAAHPTLPFLAQGANMALEDAWVLARALREGGVDALAKYQAHRRARTARIVQAASDNATAYHLRPGPARAAAHAALRLAGRFAPHVVTGRFAWVYGYDATRVPLT